MTQVVSPSATNSITSGQIGKIQELLGAALRKSGLQSEPTQSVIEQQGDALVADMVATVRKRVEAVSSMIVRHVKVNRNRTPQQVLDATGRKQYTDSKVVKAMPRGEDDETDVHFFKLGRYVSDADLEKEYELRGLKPADPYSLAAVNEADPAFADEYPNGTHWKDTSGNWCYAASASGASSSALCSSTATAAAGLATGGSPVSTSKHSGLEGLELFRPFELCPSLS